MNTQSEPGFILLVLPAEPAGSVAERARRSALAEQLAARGFQVRVVTDDEVANGSVRDASMVVLAGDARFDDGCAQTALEAGVPVLASSGTHSASPARVRDLEGRLLAARRLEVVGRLVGGVAHDFNNVLSVVSTLSELLIRFGNDDDPNREDLEEILAAARRGSELTRQLQAFARADVGDPRPVDLAERLNGAEKLIRKLLPEDIGVTVQAEDGLPDAWLDPVEADQVYFNLAAYGRWQIPGGGSLRLATELGPSGDPLVVLDLAPRPERTGPDHESVLASVATDSPVLDTHIGLQAVQEVVDRRGGRLRVVAHATGGARVEVELPRAADEGRDGERGGEIEGAGRGIVVVEDDAQVRDALARVLRALGFDVRETDSGGGALERLGDTAAEAVVCDAVLHDGWGSEVYDAARSAGFDVPFVFVSGHEEHPAVLALRRTGHTLVRKPVTAASLSSALRRVLDTR